GTLRAARPRRAPGAHRLLALRPDRGAARGPPRACAAHHVRGRGIRSRLRRTPPRADARLAAAGPRAACVAREPGSRAAVCRLGLAGARGQALRRRPAPHPRGQLARHASRRRAGSAGTDRGRFAMKPPASLHGCAAPAKLNLYLHVTGRRHDGYHEIETLFELIDLADRLDFRRRDDGRIEMPEPLPGVDPQRELSLRAAHLLADASGVCPGVDITVRKRIPMGAGLGGGSSDAATTLLALNRLWGIDWPAQRLAELGLRL